MSSLTTLAGAEEAAAARVKIPKKVRRHHLKGLRVKVLKVLNDLESGKPEEALGVRKRKRNWMHGDEKAMMMGRTNLRTQEKRIADLL